MKYLKILGLIVVIGILITSILLFAPISKNIDIELVGIQCRIGDSEYEEEKVVTLKGVYKNYLFKEDVFEGKIKIEGYEIEGYDMSSWVITNDFEFLSCYPLAYSNVSGEIKQYVFGFIFFGNGFENIMIGIFEPFGENSRVWTGDNSLYICFPADNRNEAVEIAKELTSEFDLYKNFSW